jgi:hypothetical protein
VLIPPGERVGGGMVKIARAGFLGVLWKLGRDGYQVCFNSESHSSPFVSGEMKGS